MNKINDKKIKIPGIVIFLMLIILVGSSGITFVVAGKLNVPDLNLNKLVALSNIDSSQTLNNDSNITIKETPQTTPTPTEFPANSISPASSQLPLINSTLTPKPTPKQTPKITPTPVPTPTPTPVPTTTPSPLPAHCSIKLQYRIGEIGGDFYAKDFDRERLNNIVDDAVSKWESTTGLDLFEKTNDGPNIINFVSNSGIAVLPGHFSNINYLKAYTNGTIEKFKADIYDSLFYMSENPNLIIYGGPVDQDTLNEAVISRIILHMMGHAFGLGHDQSINSSVAPAIMSDGIWSPTSYVPNLLTEDKELAESFCK